MNYVRSFMNWFHQLSIVLQDFIISFLPFVLVIFVLAILGHLNTFLSRPDASLVFAVLFSEGWWRSRKSTCAANGADQLFGLIGLVASVILVFVLFAKEYNQLTGINEQVVGWSQFVLYCSSVFYALYVRWSAP